LKIKTPSYVNLAIDQLESHGFEAYIVGGCVRDSLLGEIPHDWDIATSAMPYEMLKVFSNFKTVETGLKHGTIMVLVDDKSLEITTFRRDGTYSDSRRPDSVTFSKELKEDLSRRDFTINAMAYNEKSSIIDIFDGIADLESKIIRAVGDADKRFGEDALRIMRCLRFSSVLGFEVESKTMLAANNKRKLLRNISHERISDELKKLVCGENAENVLRENSEIIFEIMPELKIMSTCTQESRYHIYNVWEHSLRAMSAIPAKPNLRLAALLHDCGKSACKTFDKNGSAHFYGHAKKSMDIAEIILKRLRFSNREIDCILSLIKYHSEILPISEKRIKKIISKLGENAFFDLLMLIRADISAQSSDLFEERSIQIDECLKTAKMIIASSACLSLKDLAINGNDLIELGFAKDKKLGETLNIILNLVLENRAENDRAVLLKIAKAML